MFQLGKYHAVKCQELAAVSMHAGEMFQLACPDAYAHGGSAFYADGDDSFQVPPHTPLTYNFNVLDCQSDLSVLKTNVQAFHDKIVAQREKEQEEQRKKQEEEQKKKEAEEKAAAEAKKKEEEAKHEAGHDVKKEKHDKAVEEVEKAAPKKEDKPAPKTEDEKAEETKEDVHESSHIKEEKEELHQEED